MGLEQRANSPTELQKSISRLSMDVFHKPGEDVRFQHSDLNGGSPVTFSRAALGILCQAETGRPNFDYHPNGNGYLARLKELGLVTETEQKGIQLSDEARSGLYIVDVIMVR